MKNFYLYNILHLFTFQTPIFTYIKLNEYYNYTDSVFLEVKLHFQNGKNVGLHSKKKVKFYF